VLLICRKTASAVKPAEERKARVRQPHGRADRNNWNSMNRVLFASFIAGGVNLYVLTPKVCKAADV